jgi:exosortase
MKSGNSHPSIKVGVFSIGSLAAAFLFVYLPVWRRLAAAWSSNDEYSHGFLIIPICLYILFREKPEIARCQVVPSNWGFVIFAMGLVIYIFSHLAEIMTLASLSMVLVIAGMVIYICGFGVFGKLRFPIFLMLFMIPVPAQIYSSATLPLQLMVSKASVWLIDVAGVPVYREGNMIRLTEKSLEVVQACSGLRSMISLFALSSILGYFIIKSTLSRGILILLGVPISIGVNVIRIFLIALFLYFLRYDLTDESIHGLFGLVIFSFAMALIIGAGRILSLWDRSVERN